MIIKWLDEARLIPKVGRLETGQTRDLPDDTAQSFINQGQAEKVIPKKIKPVKTED